ncbi:MAG: DUF5719 family protein [Bifidobacteriaceae bacterium]|jgi:hypothetical protein|nr:DUF5719 family protein [Bifidobacteriaceae bacterium]
MRIIRRIGAIVMAVVLVGASAGLIVADRRWPPAAAQAGAPEVIDVPPGDAEVVCAGALRLPGDGEGQVVYDPRFDPAPTAVDSITRGLVASPAGGLEQALDEGSAAARLNAAGRDVAISSATVGESPISLTAFADAEDPAGEPMAAGATFQHWADGDLRGVAAAACVAPATEAWVVAGSTETGSSARLILVNPGLKDVRADLQVWDGAGPVEAVGLSGLVVPKSSQRAVLLEGFIGEAARLAVHVTASGGELAVFLQHSRLQGLTQGGVELAAPGGAPATSVTVPGLSVTDSTFDSARTSALRVLNTGPDPALVNVELWGPDGPTSLPGLEDAVLNPGVVTDLSLGGLPGGSYVAVIESDQPVVAAGLSLRAAGEDGGPEEFAWTQATASGEEGYVTLPGGDLAIRLVVAADQATNLELTPIDLLGQAGATTTVAVAAKTSQALDLAAMGGDETTAAVAFSWDGPGGALALTVSAADPAGQMISALTPPAARTGATAVTVWPAGP